LRTQRRNKMNNNFLYERGFEMVNIIPYKSDTLEIRPINSKGIEIFHSGGRWMALNIETLTEVFEVYNHWKLAQGHCICTGLGFVLRESWLLSKKEVTKLTVIEKNQELINYQWKCNPSIMERMEVICADVYDYHGSCDTLLIDNFEGGINFENDFCRAAAQISKNIRHQTMWFWPLEYFIGTHYKNHLGMSLESLYDRYRRYFNFHTLPDYNEDELFDLCYIHHRGNFKRCNFNQLRHEI